MTTATMKDRLASAEVIRFPGWSNPDLSIVDAGRRTPPTLSKGMFGRAWPECERLALDKGAPVDYVALSYLTVAASVIGGKRKARPYRESGWAEPPIIWLGLVGDPSCNKSPALDPLLEILRKIENERAEDHKEKLREHQADLERAKVEKATWQALVKDAAKEGLSTPPLPDIAVEPQVPRRPRMYVQDATPESMGDVLSASPHGTLLLRDELDGWLQSFDRYNPGGKSYWLEAYRGKPYTIDRKSSPEPVVVGFNGVSIIGGIQPGKLAESLLGKVDDGLPARFLWIWPDRPAWCRPCSSANLGAFEAAIRRLEQLAWGVDEDGRDVAVTLSLDPDAADVFAGIQQFHRKEGDEAFGLLKSFIGKLDGIALRLSLTVELARWAYEGGEEPRSIRRETVEAVGDFLEGYAIPMAARVYGDAALPPVERNAAMLARHITRHKLDRFNARSLRRESGLPGLRDAEAMRLAIEALVEADWLKPDGNRQGQTPGRQSSDYLVNPAVLEQA